MIIYNCSQFIDNLKYYIKNNKLHELYIIVKYGYLEIHEINKIYKDISINNLKYLNKDIFNYIYKYGYKYKVIKLSCKLISKIIHIIKENSQNKNSNHNLICLDYFINFAKYIKKKKSKSYLKVNDYLLKKEYSNYIRFVKYLKNDKLNNLTFIDIYLFKYYSNILTYLNKIVNKSNNEKYFYKYLQIFNLIIDNNLIDYIYKLNINDVISELKYYIDIIFYDLILYGCTNNNFIQLHKFVTFICANKNLFEKANVHLINNIIDIMYLFEYKCVNYNIVHNNKLRNIFYNCIVIKNENCVLDGVKLLNNDELYNSLYQIISDTYFYKSNESFYLNIIYYLNRNIFNGRDFLSTKIISPIRNTIIDLNIINTLEFNNVLKKHSDLYLSCNHKFIFSI